MGLRPLNDRVLIKRLEEEEKTAGGIIIPDAAKEKPQRGEVVAVGNGRMMDNNQRREMGVKAGEKVFFTKNAANEIKIDGEELIIMREDEILAVIEA